VSPLLAAATNKCSSSRATVEGRRWGFDALNVLSSPIGGCILISGGIKVAQSIEHFPSPYLDALAGDKIQEIEKSYGVGVFPAWHGIVVLGSHDYECQ